jgi:PhoPQ-activated pathogenicity-related protein
MHRLKTKLLVSAILMLQIAWLQADLKSYVEREDLTFSWKVVQKHDISPDMKGFSLELTSQTWQGIEWKHALRVVLPVKPVTSNSILIVGGSRRDNSERIESDLEKGREVAEGIAAPVALLYDVPNQPLFGDLKEDRLLAETFTRYKNTGDSDWPIIFPMVKSVVRAMDALQEFLKKEAGLTQGKFLVTGASKRGWTSWMSPIVDDRVFGIAPMVYDNLNIPIQMDYQLESWGDYSHSIRAYTEKDLPQKLKQGDGPVAKLAKMIDPYTYIRELTVPKLLVNGSNDPFWVLDAVKHYLDELPGETYLHYAPNAGHGLEEGRETIVSTVVTFFKYLDKRIEMPNIRYEVGPISETNLARQLVYTSSIEPWEVSLVIAKSPTRDFRKAKWVSLPLLEKRDRFSKTIEPIEGEYQAFYCQGVYYFDGEEMALSTIVEVIEPKATVKK